MKKISRIIRSKLLLKLHFIYLLIYIFMLEKADIGLSYIITYILNEIGTTPFAWDWPWIKIKLVLNLISIIGWIILLAIMLYWLWDNYIIQPSKWQDMSWDKKDAWRILGWSIWGAILLSKLGWVIFGWIIVYFMS